MLARWGGQHRRNWHNWMSLTSVPMVAMMGVGVMTLVAVRAIHDSAVRHDVRPVTGDGVLVAVSCHRGPGLLRFRVG